MWDASGAGMYRTIVQGYIRNGYCGVMLVFDLNDTRSFESVSSHWWSEVTNYAHPTAVRMLVGTNKGPGTAPGTGMGGGGVSGTIASPTSDNDDDDTDHGERNIVHQAAAAFAKEKGIRYMVWSAANPPAGTRIVVEQLTRDMANIHNSK